VGTLKGIDSERSESARAGLLRLFGNFLTGTMSSWYAKGRLKSSGGDNGRVHGGTRESSQLNLIDEQELIDLAVAMGNIKAPSG
jgi:hypothetical protein